MAHLLLGQSSIGASSFFASSFHPDACGENGLPLTLSSVKILGRFQRLKTLSHRSLCAYVSLVRAKHDRLIQVSEFHGKSLEDLIKSRTTMGVLSIQQIAWQILDGLSFLNQKGMVHRALSPENVLLTAEDQVKLYNCGLYYMTDCGKDVTFPIGHPRYLAPEVIASGVRSTSPCGPKVDVWSLGVILLELFMGQHLFPDLSFPNGLTVMLQRVMRTVHNYQKNSIHPLDYFLKENQAMDKVLDPELRSFLQACLCPVPTKRPLPSELLDHTFFQLMGKPQPPEPALLAMPSPFMSLCTTRDIDMSQLTTKVAQGRQAGGSEECDDLLNQRLIQEVFHWWSLAGGDLEAELRKNGVINLQPPICRLPSVVTREGGVFGLDHDSTHFFDDRTVVLPLKQLRQRLEHLTVSDYYPVLEYCSEEDGVCGSPVKREDASLPTAIKEANVEYQFHRAVLFKRLIAGYPYTSERLLAEAKIDISPLYRGEIWACLLGVKGDVQGLYRKIDKDSPHPSDRQIAVDIPRCHQYHDLLSSPTAHHKLKRVLKAWVVSHPHLVYWQGLDSLCAPFVVLNYDNEALAAACLAAFVDKYLHGFFWKDNSAVMQECLAMFSQLIAFHDPELCTHLTLNDFIPQLYAIPWFLTMYTHVLSLPKIYHLWDVLLLRDGGFPLCVGLAILSQLRHSLMGFDFNECILFFSDLPDVDIGQCIQDATKLYHSTPPSVFVREYNGLVQPISGVPPEARKVPLSLEQLQSDCSPWISPHDIIVICGLESVALGYEAADTGSAPTKNRKQSRRPKMVVVDIRTADEYQRGHVPHAVNIPEGQVWTDEGDVIVSASTTTLTQARERSVIVVMGNTPETCASFARSLVEKGYPRVCCVQGGAQRLRVLGLLTNIGKDP